MRFNERTIIIELHRGFAQSQTVNPSPETVNGFTGEILVDGAKPTFRPPFMGEGGPACHVKRRDPCS